MTAPDLSALLAVPPRIGRRLENAVVAYYDGNPEKRGFAKLVCELEDAHREYIAAIVAARDAMLLDGVVEGPCSIDCDTDYDEDGPRTTWWVQRPTNPTESIPCDTEPEARAVANALNLLAQRRNP